MYENMSGSDKHEMLTVVTSEGWQGDGLREGAGPSL